MRKEVFITCIILLFVLLVSCTVLQAPESSPPPAPALPLPSIEPPVIEKVIPAVYVRDIDSLLSKSRGVTNYRYFFDAGKPKSYDIFVRDHNIKKVYPTPLKLRGEIFYDTVYLNVEQQTAVTICTELGVLCSPTWNKAYNTNFEQEMVSPILANLIVDIPYTAKVVGTEVFDNHNAIIIEYLNADGLREQLSLDTFSGFPIRQRVFSSADDNSVVEHHTFTKLGVGNVFEDDVTLPDDYVVVN